MGMHDGSAPVWLSPWIAVETEAVDLENELRREVGPGHPLYEIQASAIARRLDDDDVLFTLAAEDNRFAVVHLTWSGRREMDPAWPMVEFYLGLNDWIDRRMTLDHRTYESPSNEASSSRYIGGGDAPRIDSPRERVSLSQFLRQDVGTSLMACRDFVEAMRMVARQGGSACWEWGGNAHTLEIFPEYVRITSDLDPSAAPLTISIEEFARVVSGWLDMLGGAAEAGPR